MNFITGLFNMKKFLPKWQLSKKVESMQLCVFTHCFHTDHNFGPLHLSKVNL